MPVISVELDDHLYGKIAEFVKSQEGSVEEFVRVAAKAQLIAAYEETGWLRQRASRGSREKLQRILDRVPHAPPDPADEL